MSRTFAELGVFLVGSLLWAWALTTAAAAAGVDLQAMDGRQAGLLGASSLVGLAALAIGLSARSGPLRETLALRPVEGRWLAVAAGAGLGVWALPTWLLGQAVARWEIDGGALEQASRWMVDGRPDERAAMWLAVCVVAPLTEEVVFRGHLWRVFAKASSPSGTLVATSMMFAAYHGDLLQSAGVLPVAGLLGWLRSRTGSLWPGVVAHAANNLGAAMALLTLPAHEPRLPLSIAALGAVCAGACVLLAARWPSPDGAPRP